jgi:hypothetical protein
METIVEESTTEFVRRFQLQLLSSKVKSSAKPNQDDEVHGKIPRKSRDGAE